MKLEIELLVTKTVDRKSRRLALPKMDIFTLGKWIWNWKWNEIMPRRFVRSLEDWQTPPMATTSSFLIGYVLCGKWKWSQKRKLNQLTLRWYQHKTYIISHYPYLAPFQIFNIPATFWQAIYILNNICRNTPKHCEVNVCSLSIFIIGSFWIQLTPNMFAKLRKCKR